MEGNGVDQWNDKACTRLLSHRQRAGRGMKAVNLNTRPGDAAEAFEHYWADIPLCCGTHWHQANMLTRMAAILIDTVSRGVLQPTCSRGPGTPGGARSWPRQGRSSGQGPGRDRGRCSP